jgi:ATP-dependent DNA helicase Q1
MAERDNTYLSRYFSASSQLSMSSWTTDDSDALARCGHCDNCTRAPEILDHRDMTTEAWQILKIVEAVKRSGGCLTLTQLAELARGAGGGAYEVTSRRGGRRGNERSKEKLDLDAVAGGNVDLSKEVGTLHVIFRVAVR